MDRKTLKRYRDKIFNRALLDAKQILDSKGEKVKLFFQIFLWIGLFAFSVPIIYLLFQDEWSGFVNFFISLRSYAVEGGHAKLVA